MIRCMFVDKKMRKCLVGNGKMITFAAKRFTKDIKRFTKDTKDTKKRYDEERDMDVDGGVGGTCGCRTAGGLS